MINSPLIQLQTIGKTYQTGKISFTALKNINLTINQGEYMAILGPSGSGKTTLMNILGCLDTPTIGSYLLNNKEVAKLNRRELAWVRNHQIGFVFQSFNLLTYASALDNVALPLVYRGINTTKRNQAAYQLLEQLGLSEHVHHKPNELSGGQKQRVAIARALVTEPSVILADEPTGNLDSRSGQEVIAILENLSNAGKTIIIVTHDLQLAKRTRRIIEIQDGEIAKDSG